MPLLNYSTKVPAEQTIGEIMKILRNAKAKSILTNYDDDGRIIGLSFRIETPNGIMPYKLPSRTEKVLQVMKNQYAAGELKTHGIVLDEEQAERVAWRQLRTWLQGQLALLESEMVTMDQLFLPFLILRENRTLYDELMEGGFKRLALPSGG